MCHRFPCVCAKQSVTIFYIDQKLPQRLFWSCTLLLTIKKTLASQVLIWLLKQILQVGKSTMHSVSSIRPCFAFASDFNSCIFCNFWSIYSITCQGFGWLLWIFLHSPQEVGDQWNRCKQLKSTTFMVEEEDNIPEIGFFLSWWQSRSKVGFNHQWVWYLALLAWLMIGWNKDRVGQQKKLQK